MRKLCLCGTAQSFGQTDTLTMKVLWLLRSRARHIPGTKGSFTVQSSPSLHEKTNGIHHRGLGVASEVLSRGKGKLTTWWSLERYIFQVGNTHICWVLLRHQPVKDKKASGVGVLQVCVIHDWPWFDSGTVLESQSSTRGDS